MVQYNVQLQKFNTLNLSAIAKQFHRISDENELRTLFVNDIVKNDCFKVIGSGSNIWLSSKEIPVVIKLENKGINIQRSEKTTIVVAKAGEDWSCFVDLLVSENIGGLEFLSSIPGTVGAAPIQNIGAYGTEVCQYIKSVRVFDTRTYEFKTFINSECNFSYRDSFFKSSNNSFVITEVEFEFANDYEPNIRGNELKTAMSSGNFSIKNIAKNIKNIRSIKLPNPIIEPNAGSFFKNPILNKSELDKLILKCEDLGYYEYETDYKISAAWIIEHAGWKGKNVDGVAMSTMHSLVLTNISTNSLTRIDYFVTLLKKDISERFGINLEVEPVFW